MIEVTLNGKTIPLHPPTSLAAAFDVAAATGKNSSRGLYAALGLCWGGKQRLRSKFSDSYNALEYGGQVFDEMLAAGLNAGEITTAAVEALTLLVSVLPSSDEVQAAEGNLETSEGSTSP